MIFFEPRIGDLAGWHSALIIDPANPQDEIAADHDYVIQLQEWLIHCHIGHHTTNNNV